MKNEELLKKVPYSQEAEQSVLGGLLLDNSRWDDVSDKVSGSDFYLRYHRVIFDASRKLLEAGQPLDLITLSELLEKQEKLEDVGGFAYLADLAKNTPSAANITAYSEIVREKAVLRNVISVGNEIVSSAYDSKEVSSTELIDSIESKVLAISNQHSVSVDSMQSLGNVLEKTLGRMEELLHTAQDGVTGLSTGFTDLNKKTAGLQNSDLIIVAARPSMGKTTFAMNLCENAAMENDKPVLIFSLEMPSEQLMMRMLSSLSRVDLTKIRTSQLDDEDWAKISGASGMLMERDNIFIDDRSGITPTELRVKARRMAREHGGLSMIMVDYLQLMQVPGLQGNRTLEIAEISRSLKALAKELNVPVVALSQLNRTLESRPDKRPINSDLRESGSIEQDADLIMFIYRDEVYHEDSKDKGTAEIIIGKQRNGPIGNVRLTFQGQYSRFDNFAGPSYDEY
ncbi:replicative DNA helicase [Vibrio vulnificus]|uniref:replicative DNA helicase n=1 Tax=Vibrio vulnificus TaxID=672 RepID=UPI000CD2CEA1|nr:replicative DNA helicase [Vibrio vulnificus]POC05632.1 replicative DNA helicase [Vibrio vulnificus]POC76679.1 replicative DNA helicase [Vibrio vulnificus]